MPTQTPDGAEGVQMFGGQQWSRQLADEFLQQSRGVVRTDLIPTERTPVKRLLQLLLKNLQQTHHQPRERHDNTFTNYTHHIR